MDSNRSIWVLIGPYSSLCVLIDFKWVFLVPICPNSSLWILMGPDGSL